MITVYPKGALANGGSDISEPDTLRQEADRIGFICQLYAEYQTIMADALSIAYLPVLQQLCLTKDSKTGSPPAPHH